MITCSDENAVSSLDGDFWGWSLDRDPQVKKVWLWSAIEIITMELQIPWGSRNFLASTVEHSNSIGTCPWWRALACTKVTWNINDFVQWNNNSKFEGILNVVILTCYLTFQGNQISTTWSVGNFRGVGPQIIVQNFATELFSIDRDPDPNNPGLTYIPESTHYFEPDLWIGWSDRILWYQGLSYRPHFYKPLVVQVS